MRDVVTLPGRNADRLRTSAFVVLPLGSIEYHGAHAPLGVDTTLAQGFARELGERFDCVVLPPIAYTFAPTITSGRPGTLSVSPAVFLAYLEEVLGTGARRVLAVNAHSENQFALRLAAERLAGEVPDVSVAIANWWRFVPAPSEGAGDAPPFGEAGGHGHGGPLEISATAAFDARGIDPLQSPDVPYEAPWWRAAAQVVGAGGAPLGFEGYHGRVSEISIEAGREVVRGAVEGLSRFVEDWLARAAAAQGDTSAPGSAR